MPPKKPIRLQRASQPMTREDAYEKMANLTLELCDKLCTSTFPYRCCEPVYCEMAIGYARENGVELKRTDHPEMPLMDEQNRCTAPAHLRPLCAAHHCDIHSLGFFKPRDGFPPREALKMTRRYFKLRDEAGEP